MVFFKKSNFHMFCINKHYIVKFSLVFLGCGAGRCLSLVLGKLLAECQAVTPGLQLPRLSQTLQGLPVLVVQAQWSPGIATTRVPFFVSKFCLLKEQIKNPSLFRTLCVSFPSGLQPMSGPLKDYRNFVRKKPYKTDSDYT